MHSKHEDLKFRFLNTYVKGQISTVCVYHPTLGSRNRKTAEVCWPGSLLKLMIFKFSERLSQKVGSRLTEVDTKPSILR